MIVCRCCYCLIELEEKKGQSQGPPLVIPYLIMHNRVNSRRKILETYNAHMCLLRLGTVVDNFDFKVKLKATKFPRCLIKDMNINLLGTDEESLGEP